ncbi:MAG TPA: copper transporter [Acidimicrobiia bacterium]|nr:copper transporter [Acidimicrobiia bacterium]
MVNFRFHLVSLIAVFLALGLGILVGSSVVDRVIVDRLDDEIASVRSESAQRNAENGRLNDQLKKLDEFVRDSAQYSVAGRLAKQPVLLVADKSVDENAAKDVLATLRAAGATAPGILWIPDRWRLDSPQDVAALHDAADVTGNAAAARTAAIEKLATRFAAKPTAATRRTDVVAPLQDAKFLEWTEGSASALGAFPASRSRVVILTGTDTQLASSETVVGLARALTGEGVPVVVGEIYDGNGGSPERGRVLTPIRGDTTLTKQVSTVDDAEMVQGRVALAIAMQQAVDDVIGHYGYGRGASAALPQPAAP